MKRIIIDQIWSELSELMDASPPHSEEVFHQFMVKYPILIPVWRPLESVVYSKFPLGAEFVTDFAFVRDDSEGLRWHFIEIEKPSDRLLRSNGDPTAKLTQAMSQMHRWAEWFNSNRAYVKENFPFGTRSRQIGLADPHLTLVMGRRSADVWQQREILRRYGGDISIRTFDGLQTNLTVPVLENDGELRCLSYSARGWDKQLSSMKLEISYYVC